MSLKWKTSPDSNYTLAQSNLFGVGYVKYRQKENDYEWYANGLQTSGKRLGACATEKAARAALTRAWKRWLKEAGLVEVSTVNNEMTRYSLPIYAPKNFKPSKVY